jgi:hypothetical protein
MNKICIYCEDELNMCPDFGKILGIRMLNRIETLKSQSFKKRCSLRGLNSLPPVHKAGALPSELKELG